MRKGILWYDFVGVCVIKVWLLWWWLKNNFNLDSVEVTTWEAPPEAGDEACVMICPFCF